MFLLTMKRNRYENLQSLRKSIPIYNKQNTRICRMNTIIYNDILTNNKKKKKLRAQGCPILYIASNVVNYRKDR